MYSRGSMSLPLKDAHVREAAFCCNERLTGALILPPNGRGGRTPLDERDGVSVVHTTSVRLQTFRSLMNRLATPIQLPVALHYSRTIGEVRNVCLYKWHIW